MTDEQRIRNLERAVAMLIAAQSQNEPEHYYAASIGAPIRLTFAERYDGGFDVSFEPA